MSTDSAAETLGPYRTDRLLSAGAHAQVWLARGPEGEVALKVARTEAHREALAHEARALEVAQHPRLVRLLRRASDASWMALERVDGQPIDQWAQDRLPSQIAAAARDVLDAVRHMHSKGVIHGDLKPQNVLVEKNGHAKVLDLGIATLPGEVTRGFRGTPGYAAPELLRGERARPATDIYGFGAMLYAAVTGRPPFVAPDPAALAYLPLVSLPAPPSAFRTDLPAVLNQLILALLARDPARRPNNLDKIEEALRKGGSGAVAAAVVGMHEEREELRRAVVGVADGECRVIVLYGPPGSGRRTLLTEAVEAARREGLTFLPEAEPKDLLAQLQEHKKGKRSAVIALRANQAGAVSLARTLLDQAFPVLVLVHSDRPLPALEGSATTQLTPSPLSREEAEVFVRLQGGDAEEAAAWWRESFGHPIALLGRVRRGRRTAGADATQMDRELPPPSRKVLQTMRRSGEQKLPEIAKQAGFGEHELLDHCEILFAEGLIEPCQDGAALRVTPLGNRSTPTPA